MRKANYPYSLLRAQRKSVVQKVTSMATKRSDFNPKDARYKSVKGMKLTKTERIFWLMLQLSPMVLVALYTFLRYFI